MAKVVQFTEARAKLTELLDEVERLHEHLVITRNGRPTAVLLAQDEYEALLETLEIVQDPDLMADLDETDAEVASGRLVPWAEVKQELGLP